MELSVFRSLPSPLGQAALEAAAALDPTEAQFLPLFEHLTRSFPREIAREALALAILRASPGAVAKFGRDAANMYFTREALEQASSKEVSSWRARRYRRFDVVADLGCSVGADTIRLAQRARAGDRPATIGVDLDPVRVEMAAANARAVGVAGHTAFVIADLERPLPLTRGPGTALFFDPGRRHGQRRARSVTQYQPPLAVIGGWLPHWPALGVKLSPAVRLEEVEGYEAELEFVSVAGELKEAVAWLGPLGGGPGRRRATVLPGGHTMAGSPDHATRAGRPPNLSAPRGWLLEPDPAVIRAGLVRALGMELGAPQLHPDIAFLTADADVESPFARSFRIEDWMPFQLKRLRAYLRQRGVGRVTVKKRGSPLDAQHIARQLRARGDRHRLLVLTRCDDKPIVVVCV